MTNTDINLALLRYFVEITNSIQNLSHDHVIKIINPKVTYMIILFRLFNPS